MKEKKKLHKLTRYACIHIIERANVGTLLKLFLVVFLIFIGASICSASATNVYIAQNSAGVGNGADCADALPVSWFNNHGNWGNGPVQVGPGTTVHLCGTFTGAAGTN